LHYIAEVISIGPGHVLDSWWR